MFIATYSLLLAASVASGPLNIARVEELPAPDRAQVDKLEADFFRLLARDGAQKTLVDTFTAAGVAERITPEVRLKFQLIDEQCPGVSLVELIATQAYGSQIVHDTFVAAQGTCMIKWDIWYIKRGDRWGFDRFNFLTFDGNQW